VPGNSSAARMYQRRRGHGPPPKQTSSVFAGALYLFSELLEKQHKGQSDSRRRHWLAPLEQNYWLRFCQVILLFSLRQKVVQSIHEIYNTEVIVNKFIRSSCNPRKNSNSTQFCKSLP